ncbi:MAG: SDR family NAD(P)-dependent oxidoreductase [Hyphomicrobiaceae bacterium]|nr:MAG: SDR family NAD(P)-dependent oxidoreductase [Hyphomicrobiaceae bacterium]
MRLQGKVAWVTGAGSGIGEAAALALAEEGASIVLTGRTQAKLASVASRIRAAGGVAEVAPADVTKASDVSALVGRIKASFGRLDILVNNAGLNVPDRSWDKMTAAGAETVIDGNLKSAFLCVIAALPIMRAQGDGLLIHTSSWAGRFVGLMSGAAYLSAKHAIVAMSHSINMEECIHGIRSSVFCPAEVATPILDNRPRPPTKEERAQMLQPEDCGDLIRYIACLPKHVCMNEVLLSPTHNRGYVAALKGRAQI